MAPEPSNLNAFGLTASLVGSYLSFASAIIVATIWPIFGLLVIWMFRSHVVGLLPFVERFEVWGAKVELKRELSQAEKDHAVGSILTTPEEVIPPRPDEPKVAPAEDASFKEALDLLRKDPGRVPTPALRRISRLKDPAHSIDLAWEEIRVAVNQAAFALGFANHFSSFAPGVLATASQFASTSLIQLLSDLEAIHRRVLSSPRTADLSDAYRFATLAETALFELRMVIEAASISGRNTNTPKSE